MQKCSAQYHVGNNPVDRPRQSPRRAFTIKNITANKSAKSALLAIPNRKLPASPNTAHSYVHAVSRRSGLRPDGAKRRSADPAVVRQVVRQRESASAHCDRHVGKKQGGEERKSEGVNQSTVDPSTFVWRCLKAHDVVPGFADRYTIGDKLGSGGFGFVVSAIRHPDNTDVAVKFIWKDKVPVHAWVKDPVLGLIPMEIYVLKAVDHPGIIRFLEYFEDTRYFYLVMERHGAPWKSGAEQQRLPLPPYKVANIGQETTGRPAVRRSATAANLGERAELGSASEARKAAGNENTMAQPTTALPTPAPHKRMAHRGFCDLFECIEQKSRFSEEDARYVFAQLADVVKYLKSVGICHRDVSNENIVINRDLGIKLVDFGSAVVTTRRRIFHSFHGSLRCASPEILRGEPYDADAAEVWSLGVLLYTLLTGEVPFADPAQAVRDRHPAPRVRVSASAVDLLDWMLEKDAARRPDVVQVCRHPWLDPAAARPAPARRPPAFPAAAD